MAGGRIAVGHPVDVASGEFFTFASDLVLGGTVPLVVGRCYRAPLESRTALFRPAYEPPQLHPFGPGWSLCGAPALERTGSGFALTTLNGDRLAIREKRDGDLFATGRVVDAASGVELRRTSPTEVRAVRFGLTRYPLDMVFQDDGASGFRAVSFARTRHARLDFTHDPQGRLVAFHQRREGRTARLIWDAHRVRQLVLEVPPPAADGTFVRPNVSPVSRILLSFDYDRWGRLTDVRDDDGVRTQYRYDASGRMDRERSRSGSLYSMAYDRRGRCVRVSGEDRYQERTLTYRERETLVADSHGRITRYIANAAGQIIQEKSPSGNLTVTTFDDLGRRTETIDPRGGATTWTYDELGRTSSVTTPDGVIERYAHDSEHHLVTREEEPGRRVDFTYDAEGGMVGMRTGAHSWSITRNEFGEWARLTNPLGHSRIALRDVYGHVRGASDFLGAVVRYERDEMGRVSARVDPLGNVTRYAYDRHGQLVWQLAADGTAWTRKINASGRRHEYTRPDGLRAVVSFSSCGQTTSVQSFDGRTVEYEWDTEPGELRVVRNHAGERYEINYDVEGHVSSRTHFDGRRYALRWKKGDLREIIDPCGRVTSYSYDADGRPTLRVTPEEETRWTYIGRHVATIANANGVLAYERDENGEVVLERQGDTELRFEYDPLGRRTRLHSRHGEARFAHDANGNWTALASEGAVIEIARDKAGRETTRSITHETLGSLGALDQSFDPLGRLAGQQYRRPDGEVSWWRRTEYDVVGNPSRVRESARGTTDYLHNSSGQLVGVLHEGRASEYYEWDDRGNIFYEVETAPAVSIFEAVRADMTRIFATTSRAGGEATERRFGPGSRLTDSRSRERVVSYLHDPAGCVVEKWARLADGREETHKFAWNTRGQLVHAVLPDGRVWRYRYDALGRRIAKISPSGEVVRFVWDGRRLACELDGAVQQDSPKPGSSAMDTSNEALRRRWTYAPGDMCPSLLWSQERRAGTSFLFTDQVESVIAAVTARGTFDVVSRRTWGEGSREDTGGFCGQEVDEETGLFYNHFRYYDPAGRRYLTPDPIGPGGGLNEFAFVRSPVAAWDPLGLAAKTPACDGNAESPEDAQAKEAEDDDPKGGTYVLLDDENNVVRTGRTNDLDRRAAEHARNPALADYTFAPVDRTDDPDEQRGLEQQLYDANPGLPLNKVRPISPTNPNRPKYMQAAQNYQDRQ